MLGKILYKFRYVAVLLAFVVWMAFFDRNNWWDIYQLKKTYKKAQEERDYYRVQTERAKNEYNALFKNTDSLEKFAREKYMMKKENEDVFVIIEEEKE